ncbi:AarF/ABC1/UbiB kinase family protein [Candidatus Poribacteria bacterium]|nr:AarF/ABC1/UbiB kinase family protein [Candidatus Poribacteria bacterium]
MKINEEIYSNIKRIREILNVFVRHGFGQILVFFNLDRFFTFGRRFFRLDTSKLPEHEARLTSAERLAIALEELGPTFIKFGQIMSTRPDLLPGDIIEGFKRLQDNVQSFDSAQAKKIIEDELGKPIEEIFASFSEKPIAAASIAQVHLAVLKTGEEVVVKVQRPGIQKKILTDLRILYIIANFVDKRLGDDRIFEPLLVLDEFDKSIRREMDFITEAANTEKLYNNFKDDPDFRFAKVWWDYTTSRVLTLERLYGFRIDEQEEFIKNNIDKKKLAEKIVRAYLKQFFEDGFFHADPHMGNILIAKDGTVIMLDCGMVGYLNNELKDNFSQVFIGIVTHEFDRLTEAYIRLGMMAQPSDYIAFKRDLTDFLEKHLEVPIKQFRISEVFMDTIKNARKYNIRVNVDFLLLMRSLSMIEDISRILNPDLNIIETTRPFAFELMKKKISIKGFASNASKLFFDMIDISKDLPKQIKQILNLLQSGNLKFEISDPSEKKLYEQVNRVGNRIAISVIIAGLAIGSSIILQNSHFPTLLGFPVFGILGYLIAGFIGVFLIISILRSGKW